MHAASKITPEGVALEDRRSLLHFYTLFSKLAFSSSVRWIFPLECCLCGAQVKTTDPERWHAHETATSARVKVARIWTFSSANVGRAHHQTSIVSFKQAEKKTVVQSHVRPRKCPQKVQKAMLLAWSNSRDAPNLGPGRNNTIGLFVWFLVRCPRRENWLILLIRFILYVDTCAFISRRIKKPRSIQLLRYRNRWWVCPPCNGNWKLWQVDWDKQGWWVSLGASQMLWLAS